MVFIDKNRFLNFFESVLCLLIIVLAELINEKTGNPSPIVYKPRRNWDSKPRLLSSNEKAKKVLNFEPDLNFEDNIEKTVEWFKNNWSNVKKNAAFGPGMSSAVRD